jgi:hypothetical protein
VRPARRRENGGSLDGTSRVYGDFNGDDTADVAILRENGDGGMNVCWHDEPPTEQIGAMRRVRSSVATRPCVASRKARWGLVSMDVGGWPSRVAGLRVGVRR